MCQGQIGGEIKFQEEVMEGYSIVGFFQKGGLFMYPILLVFLAGLAITVERWVQLNRTRSVNRKMMISKDDSTISQMLGMGLARTGVVRRREDIEIAMEESMMEIIPQLEKRTPYVALLSNIATLLGLLGTISAAFKYRYSARTARHHYGADRGLYCSCQCESCREGGPALGQYFGGHEHHGLRSDVGDSASAFPCISVAMNTTAFGLMSAIPLLLIHAKLTSTTGQIVDNLEMASVKALNTISNFAKRQFDRS
jgi:biopolymer transport protein ExbB